MSNGKKMIALALATFIALIVVGAVWSGKGGDTTGANTGTAADVIAAQGLTGDTVPPSQVGINAVANEAGHLHVAVNMSWLLMTGYLVLFMQVGFAFAGDRPHASEKRGAHDDDERRRVRDSARGVLRGGLRVPLRRRRRDRELRWDESVERAVPARQLGPHRVARFLPAEWPRLRRRRDRAVPVPGRVHGDGRLHHHRRHRRADLVRGLHRRASSRWVRSSTRSTATGSGAADGWRTSARRCTGATARSTSPAPASSTRPADGPPSRWRWCSAHASASSTPTAARTRSRVTTSGTS